MYRSLSTTLTAALGRSLSFWLLLAFLAATGAYVITLQHGFVFDDGMVIVRNEAIRSLRSIPEIFTTTEWAGGGRENHMYRPFTTTTYALNYAISDLNPRNYHLVNVVLHGGVSALAVLLGVAWGLPVAAAGIAALVFAVHPIHVEAVAGVVGRKELLACLFLIAMVLLHRRALRRGGLSLLLPPLAYAGAMLSKEIGLVGIGIVALCEVLKQHPAVRVPARRRTFLFSAYAGLVVAYLALHAVVAGALPAAEIPFFDNPAASAPLAVRWMTGIGVIGKGLLLQVAPVNQSPDYSYNAIPLVIDAVDWRLVVGSALIVTWICTGLKLRNTEPVVILGVGWYLLTILPASNLILPAGTIFAERLLYVPSVGFLLAVGALLERALGEGLVRPRVYLAAAIGGLLLVFSLATVRYAVAWRDELSLFAVATEHTPASTKAHHKLGEAQLTAGRSDEALVATRQSLVIAPSNVKARVFLSDVLRSEGRAAEAEEEIEKALTLGPDADAFYAAGRLRRDAGHLDEAAALWSQAIAVEPAHAASLADLGTLALARGDTTLALSLLQQAAKSNPGQANAWYNLGVIHQAHGKREQAQDAFRWFTEVAGPEYAEVVARLRSGLHSR